MIRKLGLALLALALFSPTYVHAVPGTISVDLRGTPVSVSYDADGIEILGNQIIDEGGFASLVLEVEVTGSPGILEITFDRKFFDAKLTDGVDDEFFAIFDGGEEPNFSEIETTSESRTLRIELPFGTEEIEIFGTIFGASPPVEEPPVEEPPEEPPVEEPTEEPPVEEPTTTEPRTQCGPGTVLKDGVCVLEEKCGPGTILQDGQCVALPSQQSDVSTSKDFIIGGGAALVIAFIVIIILAAIARVSRTKN